MNATEQLLQKLKEVFPSFKCNLQDLRNPTEEFVTNFYIFWLSEFEVDINNLSHMQHQQTEVVGAYQDAFSSFIYKANLLKCIRAFEVVPDFGIMDIHSPSPNRTQYILKSFIEFFQFSDNCVASLMDKQEQVKERKKQLMALVKQKEDCNKHLNELVKSCGAIQEEENKLEEQTRQLQQKAPELKIQKQIAKTNIDEAEEKFKEKEKMLQKLNKEINTVTNKLKECTGMIIDSPSSLLVDMEGLREKSQELDELAEQKRNMVEEKMQKDLKLQTYLTLLQDKIQVLNELITFLKQFKNKSKVESDIEKSMKTSQEQLAELKSLLLALCNKKQMRQEVLQDVRLQWKTLEPQLLRNVEDSLRELNKQQLSKNKMISSLKEDSEVEERKTQVYDEFKRLCEQFNSCDKTWPDMQKKYFEEFEDRAKADTENFRRALAEQDSEAKARRQRKLNENKIN